MDKRLTAAILLLLACLICFGQASYQGLTPGQSTRSDVERLLGQPVNKVSETLHEFGPKWSARKIYVQYRKGSAVVERIEVLLAEPVKPADARMYFTFASPPGDPFGGNSLYRSESLRSAALSAQPVATRTRKGRLEEYFGELYYMVLTHEGEEASSHVNQIGYYSRELFDSAVAELRRTETNATAQGGGESGVWGAREDNTALNGTNLTYYPQPSIDQCQSDCAKNVNCKAFTWIRAGVYNPGDAAMCYLVSVVTGRASAPGHTSAVKRSR